MPAPPRSARRHYLWSQALVERAIRQASKAPTLSAVAVLIGQHQIAAASQAQTAVAAMLTEQAIFTKAEARLLPVAFTTATSRATAMLEQAATDFEFQRIVANLVSDAGRSAEQVATTVRPKTSWVRYLSPPSCSRCAVLAGRVYRYSQGFLRHPGCDCIMVPTTVANADFVQDPVTLMEQGLVTGMSKADQKAVADGADFNLVVNVKRSEAGLSTPGGSVARAGRPTPETIYKHATSRDDAIARLTAAGYIR